MSILISHPTPHQVTGRETAARQMAYRRLAAAILEVDVESVAAQLQARRTSVAPARRQEAQTIAHFETGGRC